MAKKPAKKAAKKVAAKKTAAKKVAVKKPSVKKPSKKKELEENGVGAVVATVQAAKEEPKKEVATRSAGQGNSLEPKDM